MKTKKKVIVKGWANHLERFPNLKAYLHERTGYAGQTCIGIYTDKFGDHGTFDIYLQSSGNTINEWWLNTLEY